jgi:DNA-binding PadR family transcriptional regulator
MAANNRTNELHLPNVRDEISQDKKDKCVLEESQKRLLKAYLDIVILTALAERSAISSPQIISFLKQKFNVEFSPGTLYPVVKKLEEKRYINQTIHGRANLYVITEKGKKWLRDFQKSLAQTQGVFFDFFKIACWTDAIQTPNPSEFKDPKTISTCDATLSTDYQTDFRR